MKSQRPLVSITLLLFWAVGCVSSRGTRPTLTLEGPQIPGLIPVALTPPDIRPSRFVWSPDSAHLAITYVRPSTGEVPFESKHQIWILDVRNSVIKLLEESDYGLRSVIAWLPDDKIAFYATGDLQEGTWTIPADGSGTRELLVANNAAYFSPDFEEIAYQKFISSPRANIWSIFVRDLRTNNEQEVFKVEGEGVSLEIEQWSPDGDALLLTLETNISFGDNIYLLDLAEKSSMPVTYGGYYGSPSWSPDGNLIVYTYQKALGKENHQGLYVMKAKAGCSVQLVQPQGHDVIYTRWSPDGRWIAFIMNNGIYLLDTTQALGENYSKYYASCP